MELEVFILGIIWEKPKNIKEILDISNFVFLNRWISFDTSELKSYVERLAKIGYLKIDNGSAEFAKRIFSVTEGGKKFYMDYLKEYMIKGEPDMQKLMLFLLFSNHLPKMEVLKGIEEKIGNIQKSLAKITMLGRERREEQDSYIQRFCMESALRYKQMEMDILKKYLEWAKGKKEWTEFLGLNDIWQFQV